MSCINVSASRIGGIGASVSRVEGINATASRVGGIGVTIGLICDVGYGRFLRVIPEEMQWITIDSSIDYSVLSNTDWEVQ